MDTATETLKDYIFYLVFSRYIGMIIYFFVMLTLSSATLHNSFSSFDNLSAYSLGFSMKTIANIPEINSLKGKA